MSGDTANSGSPLDLGRVSLRRGHVFDARLTAAVAAVKWFRTLRSAARGGGQSGNVSTRRRTVCRMSLPINLTTSAARRLCATLQMARTVIYIPVRFIDLTGNQLPKNKPVRSADVVYVNSRWIESTTVCCPTDPIRCSNLG